MTKKITAALNRFCLLALLPFLLVILAPQLSLAQQSTLTAGSNDTFIGTETGRANTNGNNNTFVGYGAQGFVGDNYTNATTVGANAAVLQSNSLVLASVNGINGATADTRGIGTNAPRHRLEVKNGSALVTNGDLIIGSAGKGVVLTSLGGNCFRLTVSDASALTVTQSAVARTDLLIIA